MIKHITIILLLQCCSIEAAETNHKDTKLSFFLCELPPVSSGVRIVPGYGTFIDPDILFMRLIQKTQEPSLTSRPQFQPCAPETSSSFLEKPSHTSEQKSKTGSTKP